MSKYRLPSPFDQEQPSSKPGRKLAGLKILPLLLTFAVAFYILRVQMHDSSSEAKATPKPTESAISLVTATATISTALHIESATTKPTPTPTTGKPSLYKGPPYKIAEGFRLRIPSVGIDAPIVAVGLSAEGEVASPQGPDLVGWYNLSPPPGSPGNSILAGHVDWKTQTAVFWNLRKANVGDQLLVSVPGKADVRYVIQSAQKYPFDQAPIDTIFASTYQPVITIITCDGVFDQSTHNYDLRFIVRAQAM